MDYELLKKSEFVQACLNLRQMISEKLKWYSKEYCKMQKDEITKEELILNIHNKIITLSELEQWEFNEVWAMSSDKNCWYVEHQVGQLIHNELMKIWYPEIQEEELNKKITFIGQ